MENINVLERIIDRLTKASGIPAYEELHRHINVALLYLQDIKRNNATLQRDGEIKLIKP